MTATGAVLVQRRSYTYDKYASQQLLKRYRRQANLLTPCRCSSFVYMDNLMSKALINELDLKMQQVKEYGLIAHGYHNENFQYPIHVRRSHDGEKVPRSLSTFDKHRRINRSTNTTLLTSLSPHKNHTALTNRKSSSKDQPSSDAPQQQTTFITPPNKTVNDIDPSIDRDQSYTTGKSFTRFYYHRKSSSSSANSSPILCSLRPHSVVCLSTTESNVTESIENSKTDEQQANPLSNSSQSLVNQSISRTPIRRLTKKIFSKFFHNSSKT